VDFREPRSFGFEAMLSSTKPLEVEKMSFPPDLSTNERSKNFPTYPWNIPQTQNQQFMKEFLSFEGLGRPGVCSRCMLGFS